ncbi:hypothetical protein E2C01_029897 [Portunus trituberculatus]|uniref:C2H2-type domain-containing protein n=1 Tax=Portunus trituberculatus TaxID=210409 RepID=A0A5B7EP35_PORTR|nr:hypothetical protein [Portunus trituberculatus]
MGSFFLTLVSSTRSYRKWRAFSFLLPKGLSAFTNTQITQATVLNKHKASSVPEQAGQEAVGEPWPLPRCFALPPSRHHTRLGQHHAVAGMPVPAPWNAASTGKHRHLTSVHALMVGSILSINVQTCSVNHSVIMLTFTRELLVINGSLEGEECLALTCTLCDTVLHSRLHLVQHHHRVHGSRTLRDLGWPLLWPVKENHIYCHQFCSKRLHTSEISAHHSETNPGTTCSQHCLSPTQQLSSSLPALTFASPAKSAGTRPSRCATIVSIAAAGWELVSSPPAVLSPDAGGLLKYALMPASIDPVK